MPWQSNVRKQCWCYTHEIKRRGDNLVRVHLCSLSHIPWDIIFDISESSKQPEYQIKWTKWQWCSEAFFRRSTIRTMRNGCNSGASLLSTKSYQKITARLPGHLLTSCMRCAMTDRPGARPLNIYSGPQAGQSVASRKDSPRHTIQQNAKLMIPYSIHSVFAQTMHKAAGAF